MKTDSISSIQLAQSATWLVVSALYFGLTRRGFPPDTELGIANGRLQVVLGQIKENPTTPKMLRDFIARNGESSSEVLIEWMTGVTQLARLSPNGNSLVLLARRGNVINLTGVNMLEMEEKDLEQFGLVLLERLQCQLEHERHHL